MFARGRKEKGRKEGRRQTARNLGAKHGPRPKQPSRTLPCCFSFLLSERDSGDRRDPPFVLKS